MTEQQQAPGAARENGAENGAGGEEEDEAEARLAFDNICALAAQQPLPLAVYLTMSGLSATKAFEIVQLALFSEGNFDWFDDVMRASRFCFFVDFQHDLE